MKQFVGPRRRRRRRKKIEQRIKKIKTKLCVGGNLQFLQQWLFVFCFL
jgi:hypothetical protein